MTKQEFMEAVMSCNPGEKISYHRGKHCGGFLKPAATELYERGVVTLVSKKHGPADFEYFVVKLKEKGK